MGQDGFKIIPWKVAQDCENALCDSIRDGAYHYTLDHRMDNTKNER